MRQPSNPVLRAALRRRAYTLIELLVVIAVIALLAALIFPVTKAINRAKVKSKVKAELAQIQFAIDDYKTRLGHYPPDVPGSHGPAQPCNHARNQLYFELMGTKQSVVAGETIYTSLDGAGVIKAGSIPMAFPAPPSGTPPSGFVNSSRGSGDEGHPAQQFLRDLKPLQVGTLAGGANQNWKILVCSVALPSGFPSPLNVTIPADRPNYNPFRYNSSRPTNNVGSYDLWVDVILEGKTNRFNNWSTEPQIVGEPL